MNPTLKKNTRTHFKKRSVQRYNLKINHEKYDQIISAICGHNIPGITARFISKSTCSRSIWEVNVDGTIMKVVYSKKHHELITALPYN